MNVLTNQWIQSDVYTFLKWGCNWSLLIFDTVRYRIEHIKNNMLTWYVIYTISQWVSQGSFWFSVTHHPAETPAPQSFLKLPEKVLMSPLIIRFNISHVSRHHQLIRIVLLCTNIPLYYCGTELHLSRWCVGTLRVDGQSDLTKAHFMNIMIMHVL